MNTRNNQTGRSMVETLGVLAIIGVLSIGGIAGYTWGMNKLRTNEILDGANKRAATVAMQRGVRTVSLREFDAERVMAGGTFASEVVTDGLRGQFGIKVTGVTEAVCENLAQLMATEENSAIRNITDASLTKLEAGNCGETNEVVLVYNNDMGTEENSEDSIDAGTCENGNVYLSYNTENECDTITPMNTKICTYASNCGNSNDFCCINSVCVLADRYDSTNGYCPVETPCKKNSDCLAEYFCGFGNASKSQDKPDTGNCLAIHEVAEKIYNEHIFLISKGFPMSWWSAENWCKKNGARLAKLSDFGNITGSCSGTACSGITWQQLKTNIGTDVYWLENATSTAGYALFAGSNSISRVDHNNMGVWALCFKN